MVKKFNERYKARVTINNSAYEINKLLDKYNIDIPRLSITDNKEVSKSFTLHDNIFIPNKHKLIKLEQIVNLCFSLTPQAIISCNENIDDSDRYVVKNQTDVRNIIRSVSSLYDLESDFEKILSNKYSIDSLVKITELDSNNNNYNAALLRIVFYIIHIFYDKEIINELNMSQLGVIGDLLLEMKAYDSAIELYNIDNVIYNNSNRLAKLALSAISLGNIEVAKKIKQRLSEVEPYHPALKLLESDIKKALNIQSLSSQSIDDNFINGLSGIEFENLVLNKFIELGFKGELTSKTGDYGADLIIENKTGTRFIIQCKRFNSKVNLKAVQEVIGAVGYYSGDCGIVITNSSFYNSALELAKSHDIELWGGNKLISFLAGDLSFSKFLNDK